MHEHTDGQRVSRVCGGGAEVPVGESHAAPVAPGPSSIDLRAGSVATTTARARLREGHAPPLPIGWPPCSPISPTRLCSCPGRHTAQRGSTGASRTTADPGAHLDAPGGDGVVVSVGESHAAPVAPEPTTMDSNAGSAVTCASDATATGGAYHRPYKVSGNPQWRLRHVRDDLVLGHRNPVAATGGDIGRNGV